MKLLDYFFEQPLLSILLVEKRLGCAFVTANKLMEQLEDLKVVRETTGWQRNRRYRYAPYLALFDALAGKITSGESS